MYNVSDLKSNSIVIGRVFLRLYEGLLFNPSDPGSLLHVEVVAGGDYGEPD